MKNQLLNEAYAGKSKIKYVKIMKNKQLPPSAIYRNQVSNH